MQTGYILLFSISPMFLDGCCVRNHPKRRTGLPEKAAQWRYKSVEGECFIMPSVNEEVAWTRPGESGKGNEGVSFNCGSEPSYETKPPGKYTFHTGKIHLHVMERTSLQCDEPGESSVMLVAGEGGRIRCPGLTCSDNTDVTWYKGHRAISKQPRAFCMESGWLDLCTVQKYDTGVYFCDRQITEQGVRWTYRRAVNVTVIPQNAASDPPQIMYPLSSTVEEVELGRSHNLTCEVYLRFEVIFKPQVQWHMNYEGNMGNMTLLPTEMQQKKELEFKWFKLKYGAIIKEVRNLDLKHTYTCTASNTAGSSSATVKLKKKIKAKLLSPVGYVISSLLLVAGLGITLHVKWLELQLIYRSFYLHGNLKEDEKEFDVFLSYVWSPPSAEVEGFLTHCPPSGHDGNLKACLSRLELLNPEEWWTNQRPLAALLPQVLEELWGYRLCLLERDVLPGAAYTNEVVHAIQKSQMMICLLSADYLSDSSAVFVLESGVQVLLQKSSPKLLLIQTNEKSAFERPESPLPSVVQRALRVLPRLHWTSGKPGRATSSFWSSLRKALPSHRVNSASLIQKT